jgi:hypothetical protein
MNVTADTGIALDQDNVIGTLNATNSTSGDVVVNNTQAMTASVVNDNGNIVIDNSIGKSDGDLTLGLVQSGQNLTITSDGSIFRTQNSSSIGIVGSSTSQAIVTAGTNADDDVGTSAIPLAFVNFASQNLPNGEAPIIITAGGFAYVAPGLSPVDITAGLGFELANSAINSAVAELTAADAAGREDSTDIDWAAYSKDIQLYAINNEGVQLPENMRLDEFVMLKRQMEQEEAERERLAARADGDD